MTLRTKWERAFSELKEAVDRLGAKLDRELTPGRVYTLVELAQAVRLSESTVRRAVCAGYLKSVRGSDALAWFKAGAPTGRNKSDVEAERK